MLLEYRGVSRYYGKKPKERKRVLQEVSFELEAGYLMGLVGKNGAGKTTLLKCLMETDAEYEGMILLDGQDIRQQHERVLEQIGFVSEENHFFKGCTASENGKLLGGFYKKWEEKRFEEVMKALKLPLYREVGNMSRGEYMKFQLAFAYAHHPRLYVMDEATAGMDPVFRKEFFQLLREILAEEDAAILMTTHLQTDVDKNMDYVGVMEQGKMISFGWAQE